jgi:UDP-glucose 4-epimerase
VRVAVTGGCGFIGSHVVDRLMQDGHSVVVIDQIDRVHRRAHRDDIEVVDADVLDLASLLEVTAGSDYVFHLAAVSNVNEAHQHPVYTVQVNVAGTANVIEACKRNGVKRIFLASTVWVYAGARGSGALTEEEPFYLPNAGHIYTSSKIAGEMILHNYRELYGQPFTILRYGIPYGPRMREELVIPRFVRMALSGDPITINGDGSQFRNYMYVTDLAEAHVLALSKEAENEVFNLEGPERVSLLRVVECLREILGDAVSVTFGPPRPGDYKGKEVSGEKAARVLGWRPMTSFEEGLRRYVDWYVGHRSYEAEALPDGPGGRP